jgi:guanylate kinase
MPKVFVIAGPSGVGKTYLAELCLRKFPDLFQQVSLYTTRQPRSGETFVDRIFVDEQTFLAKKEQGDFFIADQFHDNWYGWEKQALQTADKNLIVNVWPSLLPKFQDFPGVRFIGMSVPSDKLELLKKRMRARGDSDQKIEERVKLINQDLKDLEKLQALVEEYGKLFRITGDQTVPEDVVPWMFEQL